VRHSTQRGLANSFSTRLVADAEFVSFTDTSRLQAALALHKDTASAARSSGESRSKFMG